MIKRLSLLTAIAVAGAAVSAQAQWVAYNSTDANNNHSPYWDNVSTDGQNCNVGFVLNGTAGNAANPCDAHNQRPSGWLPYTGAIPTTNLQGASGSFAAFYFDAGNYTFSLLPGTSQPGGDVAGLNQDWGIYDLATGDTTLFNGGLPAGLQDEGSAFGLYIVMTDGNVAYSNHDAQFALFGLDGAETGAGTYIAGFEDIYTGPKGGSDADFQDVLFQITSTGPGGPEGGPVTPEPMTMSLMAMGLVGLGGASLRRRRKNG